MKYSCRDDGMTKKKRERERMKEIGLSFSYLSILLSLRCVRLKTQFYELINMQLGRDWAGIGMKLV